MTAVFRRRHCCINLAADLGLDSVEILTSQRGLFLFFCVTKTCLLLFLRQNIDTGDQFLRYHRQFPFRRQKSIPQF